MFLYLKYNNFKRRAVPLSRRYEIYKKGESSVYFYIILQGNLRRQKITTITKILSAKEYFLYLIQMIKNEHFSLVSRMIKMNKTNFQIKLKDFDLIKDIFFYFEFHNWLLKKGSVMELKDLLKLCDQTLFLNQLNFKLLSNKEIHEDESLYKIINEKVKIKAQQTFDINHYSFVQNEEPKPVNLLEFTTDSYFQTGQVFGDNETNNSR